MQSIVLVTGGTTAIGAFTAKAFKAKGLGKPKDIARAVLFLADDEASFITGETLAVNGGFYME